MCSKSQLSQKDWGRLGKLLDWELETVLYPLWFLILQVAKYPTQRSWNKNALVCSCNWKIHMEWLSNNLDPAVHMTSLRNWLLCSSLCSVFPRSSSLTNRSLSTFSLKPFKYHIFRTIFLWWEKAWFFLAIKGSSGFQSYWIILSQASISVASNEVTNRSSTAPTPLEGRASNSLPWISWDSEKSAWFKVGN